MSVDVVDDNLTSAAYSSKYGSSGANFAAAANARLKSWGFNAVGYASFAYMANFPTGGLPYFAGQDATNGRRGGLGGIGVNLTSFPAGLVCSGAFWVFEYGQADYFAPNAAAAYINTASNASGASQITSLTNTIAIVTDEGDEPAGIDAYYHDDYGYIIGAQSPMQAPPTLSAWASSTTYTLGSMFIDDSNGNIEGVTNIAGSSECESGSGSHPTWQTSLNAITSGDGTCTWRNLGPSGDHTVYAKIALADYLANEYGCTGSPFDPDPLGATYCGSTNAANALTALNTAWHTDYEYWGTSDSGGLAGIQSGAYASYGTGTGLLDEKGTNLLVASPPCNNIVPTDSWSRYAQIETDLHKFIGTFAAKYANEVFGGWQTIYPTHPPLMLALYDPPTYVASAVAAPLLASTYLGGNAANVLAIDADDNSVTDITNLVAAMPGVPIIAGDFSTAQPDSPYSGTTCADMDMFACVTTQQLRGEGLVSYYQDTLHLQDSNGYFTVVGGEHWSYYDQKPDNFGLLSLNDNPYDQSAEINGSVGTCTTSHAYTAPTICKDSNGNYEALSNNVASCTSGGTAPTWPSSAVANLGTLTHDNTCYWADEGQPTPVPEATPIPSSATYYPEGYGDEISTLKAYLTNPTANLCDPSD